MLDYRVKSFLAVCRTGSFTRAADELHITQPAVTQHVRALESHYGCALFEREGRAMRLTAAGEVAYRRLGAFANDEARLGSELRSAQGEPERELRLGCTRTVADYLAPLLLTRERGAGALVDVALTVGNTAELTRALTAGELDLALVEGFFDRALFEAEVVAREPFVAVARAGNGALSPGARTLEDLLRCELVVRERGSGTREILERLLAARDRRIGDFARVTELGGIPAIKAVVRASDAVTFIYRMAVADELACGELEDVTPDGFAVSHDICGIWQRGSIYEDDLRALVGRWRTFLSARCRKLLTGEDEAR
ncbi:MULTISPECIES: LysR family transcriptional regulator [Collinsella]|uniref:LysR family transcriptional regulator n=1 Tax=Collinsella TaxID=102106 RepID=UPI000B3A5704|nr:MULTISPECIES: LysR family transcriptional regulator [Collinsella]MDM8162753.1 LysR family transcriptional regulator [Collinsella intestinalis]OUO64552.1 hypothetical protein B5F70_04805 [Collinsella sp. An268]